jgi:hypothetical protein
MVRGNWQRRVELSESRRNDAKQKKQRNEERKVTKAKLNELLAVMDRNKDAIWANAQRSWEIHIWTDTLPSDSPLVLDIWDDHHDGGGGGGGKSSKRRNRSASIESEGSAGGRKNSATPTSSGKKKAHPRSKESMVETEGDAPATPRLCRHQFFSGKCSRDGKKGGVCRHLHYPKKHKTMAEALNGTGDLSTDAKDLLKTCEAAHPDAQDEDTGTSDSSGSIEMLHYFSINMVQAAAASKDDAMPTFSDVVGGEMAKKSCGLGSIVYITLNENLVFDRYRDGIVISESNFLETACGVDAVKSNKKAEKDTAKSLPGSVLEYMLTFLPDTAVASMSSVCLAWNLEIGKQSVHLWKHLLQRRGWPTSSLDLTENTDDDNVDFRKAFLLHYSALRDINGLKLGMAGLLTKKSIREKEACFRSFENLRSAPQYPNSCVSVEVWSPNHVLIAYAHDCTLRLFNTVEKSGPGGERLCKELLCLCLDPFKHTKKRNCQIVGLALDDECIGCLFQVMDGNMKGEATMLSVFGREDFLLADGSIDEYAVKNIDVSQSILNFLLSCDEMDHSLLQLNDFLANYGDLDEVEVLVSQSIAPCGYGRFLVEASVSIPLVDGTDDDDGDDNMSLLFRKLFLFSSSAGAIVWMCASNPSSRPMRPRFEHMTLASRKASEDFRQGYRLTSGSSATQAIMSGSVEPGGDFHHPLMLEDSDTTIAEIVGGGWEYRRARLRPIIVLASQVIVADTYVRDLDEDRKQFKSVLSFIPSNSGGEISSYGTVQLDGNLEISSISLLRDEHIVVVGRLYVTDSDGTEFDDLDGHWFGGTTGGLVSLYAIIVHVASRSEIERICLVEDLEACLDSDIATSGELPFKVAATAGTVCAGIWWKGVIMTGQEVRHAPESSQGVDQQAHTPGKQKKKKKKTPKKGGKKDAFARGMSLRG